MLKEAESKTKSMDDEVKERFGSEIDICLGNYDQVGKVNHTDIGVFKYDFTYFMSEEELKKFPKDKLPEPIAPARAFDFSKAERVFMTKEELKRREQEEQEKLESI